MADGVVLSTMTGSALRAPSMSVDPAEQSGLVVARPQTAYGGARPQGGTGTILLPNLSRRTSESKIINKERRAALINARAADRNDAAVRSGINMRANDLVGKNLRLQSIPAFEDLNMSEDEAGDYAQAWERRFVLWGDDPRKKNDAERHSTFGSQMFEAARGIYGTDGEAALIVRYDERRARKLRSRYATYVEMLDPDRISNPMGTKDGDTRVDNQDIGGELCQGKVLDRDGAYIAFYVEDREPTKDGRVMRWQRVERETKNGRPIGIHWFPRFQVGVQRAMPAIVASLRDQRMVHTFDDKTLEMAIKATLASMVIKTDKSTAEAIAQFSGAPSGEDDAMMAMMAARFATYEGLNIEGQAVPVLAPGDELELLETQNSIPNTGEFHYVFDRKMANTLGLPYARYSNDYAKYNFAGARQALIDCWRSIFADRYEFNVSIPGLIALAHCEEMHLRQMLPLPASAPFFYDAMDEYAQCEFRGPGMGWVDPVKDQTGANLRIAAGASSPQKEAAAQGYDFYDNIDETARANAYAKRKKVGLDFNGTAGGDAQQQQADAAADDEQQQDDAAAAAAAGQGAQQQ